MTPEEINRKLAEWAGIDDDRECNFAADCPALQCWDCNAYVPPDYFHTNAAMDLLGVLVERGYKPELSYHNLNWWHKFSLPGYKQPKYYAIKPTIPAAICTAIIELIEREGRE